MQLEVEKVEAEKNVWILKNEIQTKPIETADRIREGLVALRNDWYFERVNIGNHTFELRKFLRKGAVSS